MWARFCLVRVLPLGEFLYSGAVHCLGPTVATRLETDKKVQGETGALSAASLRQRKILSNFGSVFVFSLLLRRTCRDHEDFEKHHPPLELSFCSAAACEYFDQRYNSKAAIYYCSLSPPATINISPSH